MFRLFELTKCSISVDYNTDDLILTGTDIFNEKVSKAVEVVSHVGNNTIFIDDNGVRYLVNSSEIND